MNNITKVEAESTSRAYSPMYKSEVTIIRYLGNRMSPKEFNLHYFDCRIDRGLFRGDKVTFSNYELKRLKIK